MKAPKWKPWEAGSPSQVSSYDVDADPTTACQRKWALEKVFGRKPPDKFFHTDGKNYHAVVEDYYLNGTPVTDPVLLSGFGYWPPRGSNLLIEQWFTAEVPDWPDTRPKSILNTDDIKGYPIGYGRFVGRSDILDMTGIKPVVIDFKNVSSFGYVKKPDELSVAVAMIAYGNWALTQKPLADSVVFKYIVNLKRPKNPATKWKPKSKEVRVEVSREHVEKEWGRTMQTIHSMKKLSVIQDWRQIPANRRACMAYMGCPHRDLCGYSDVALDEELEESPTLDIPDITEEPMNEIKDLYTTFQEGKFPSAASLTAFVEILSRKGSANLEPKEMVDRIFLGMAQMRVHLIGCIVNEMKHKAPLNKMFVDMLRPINAWYIMLGKSDHPSAQELRTKASHESAKEVFTWIASEINAAKAPTSADPPAPTPASDTPATPASVPDAAPTGHTYRTVRDVLSRVNDEIISVIDLAPDAAMNQNEILLRALGEEEIRMENGRVKTRTVDELEKEISDLQEKITEIKGSLPQKPGIIVFLDVFPTKHTFSGATILNGSEFMQKHKIAVAEHANVPHYKSVMYGAGPGKVVKSAQEELKMMLTSMELHNANTDNDPRYRQNAIVLFLDSTDECQRLLDHEISDIADTRMMGIAR